MKTINLISAGRILAYSILILGIIHNVATFTPFIQDGLSCLDQGNLKAMMYMSIICGTSFILSGIILIMLLKRIEDFPFLNSIIFVVGLFLAISGVLSVVYMFDNPFAWVALLLNMSMFIITLGLKVKLDKR